MYQDDELFPHYEHGELVFPGEKRSGMKDSIHMHMHACPRCGREWECSNECGETATGGSWTPMTCSLCTEHLMKLVGQTPKPIPSGWERTKTLVATSEKIVHPHTHTCIIGNHLWEHDDVNCAFETIMMDPKGMKNLECPACFVFA